MFNKKCTFTFLKWLHIITSFPPTKMCEAVLLLLCLCHAARCVSKKKVGSPRDLQSCVLLVCQRFCACSEQDPCSCSSRRRCNTNTLALARLVTLSLPRAADTTQADLFASLQVPREFEGNSMMLLNQFYLKFLGM